MDISDINTDNVEPLGDSYELIPKGEYVAMIIEERTKDTNDPTNDYKYLSLTWEILEGEYAKRRIWTNLNLWNKESTVEFAKRELVSIKMAIEKPGLRRSEEFIGLPAKIRVAIKTRKDNGELANRIQSYAPIQAGDVSVSTNKDITKNNKVVDNSSGTPVWKR